jgi:hypothetical protein
MGALVIGGAGAGAADAADSGTGPSTLPLGGGVQQNRCDTSSLIGTIEITGGGEDVTNETNCVNYSESGVSEQKNRCRTHSLVGPVTIALSPGSEVTNRTNCINVSESGGVTKQSNDCQSTSVLGPITLGPGTEVTNETNCLNVSGSGEGRSSGPAE